MTDNTLTVRDHSQPCDHKGLAYKPHWDGYWLCSACPGGREIVLRKERFWPETSVAEPCDVWLEVTE